MCWVEVLESSQCVCGEETCFRPLSVLSRVRSCRGTRVVGVLRHEEKSVQVSDPRASRVGAADRVVREGWCASYDGLGCEKGLVALKRSVLSLVLPGIVVRGALDRAFLLCPRRGLILHENNSDSLLARGMVSRDVQELASGARLLAS
jgi:hypothetical protein